MSGKAPAPRVVILSSRSIFVEGIAAHLRQKLDDQSLLVVDVQAAGALEQVIAAQPSAIILDASEAGASQLCDVGALLKALPAVTLVRLDPELEQVQVVTSEQRTLQQMQDLVDVIRTV